MNVVLCEYAEKREFTAGNKARTDTVRILKAEGYKHIPLFKSKNPKAVIFFQIVYGCIRTFFSAGRDDEVFLQYPYYPSVANKVLFKVLRFGRTIKKYRIVLLLHDVVGLRCGDKGKGILLHEVEEFNHLDKIICHNEKMRNALVNAGLCVGYAILGPFDYLCDKNVNSRVSDLLSVAIAGNLSKEKCGYVYQLPELTGVKFKLYGVGYSGDSCRNIEYCGKFAPEDLVNKIQGAYGLVWDGDSLKTCAGDFGNYLRYNDPHKFSLYLAAGIPLIVWDQSALADYVRKYSLGICVSSLERLDDELKAITSEKYQNICECVMKYRKALITGEHLKHAVEQD